MRVEPVWAEEREGSITDLACWKPVDGMTEITLPETLQRRRAVRSVRTPAAHDLHATRPARRAAATSRASPRRRSSAPGPSPAPGSTCRPAAPTRSWASRPPSRSRCRHGTLTSFCVVNVSFHGGTQEIPYTTGLILLDGSDQPIMHLIQECPVDQVRIGHAGRGGVGRRRRPRPDHGVDQVVPPASASPTSTCTSPARTAPLWLDSEEFNACDDVMSPSSGSPRPRTCAASPTSTRSRC